MRLKEKILRLILLQGAFALVCGSLPLMGAPQTTTPAQAPAATGGQQSSGAAGTPAAKGAPSTRSGSAASMANTPKKAAPTAAAAGTEATKPTGFSKNPNEKESIHQFDRYLLVFHFEELIEFDDIGNLTKQEYKFGNRGIDINPSYVTNMHANSGTVRGKGGVNQVIVLETPVNEKSKASINFIEATAFGINTVTIFEIEEQTNIFRTFYTRMINNTDHKEKKSKQTIVINKGLAYPVNKEGEHITTKSM